MLRWSCRLWNFTANTRLFASRQPGTPYLGPDERCTDTITNRTEHRPTITRTRNVQRCLGPSSLLQHRLPDVALRHGVSWAMPPVLHPCADRVTVVPTHGITIVVSYIDTVVSTHIISIFSANINPVISAFVGANINPIISAFISTFINTNCFTSVTADHGAILVADFVPDPHAADSVANTHGFHRWNDNTINTHRDRHPDNDGVACSSHTARGSADSRIELAPYCRSYSSRLDHLTDADAVSRGWRWCE